MLLHPLPLLIDSLETNPPADVVTEPILQRMETDELVFALHEVFSALLGEEPVPPDGHPGYQEAIIAELLDQCCGMVEMEVVHSSDDDDRDDARRAAWHSFMTFCGELDATGQRFFPIIEDLELVYDYPGVHTSPLLTAEIWQEMLVADGGVAAEFLWDFDWRIDEIMERCPAGKARLVAEAAGIDLDVVHRLPKTPTPHELAVARAHLRALVAGR